MILNTRAILRMISKRIESQSWKLIFSLKKHQTKICQSVSITSQSHDIFRRQSAQNNGSPLPSETNMPKMMSIGKPGDVLEECAALDDFLATRGE
jgi:hypothetical protein